MKQLRNNSHLDKLVSNHSFFGPGDDGPGGDKGGDSSGGGGFWEWLTGWWNWR